MDEESGLRKQDESVGADDAPSSRPARPGFWRRFWNRTRLIYLCVKPGPRAWRGAGIGVASAAALVYVASALWVLLLTHENLVVYIIVLGLPLLALAIGGLGLLLVRLLNLLPRLFTWALISTVTAVGFIYGGLGPKGMFTGIAACVLVGSLIGASVGILATGKGRDLTWVQRWTTVCGLVAGVALAGFAAWWLIMDGRPGKDVPNAALEAARPTRMPAQELADPSQPGPFRVLQLTYGSGSGRRRPEYAERVTIKTHTVDGSKLIERWSGRHGWARTRFWGFDAKELPLQARVWYPDGTGPFPLVLIVHGNHLMEEYSDPGYSYLGELMASRGFIFASVDENFLNSSVGDLTGFPDVGLKEENDARGWLLLEHLRLWRDWNRTPGHAFHGHVDMDRIAVAGHSRGGEAAAVAGVFNPLPFYPENARVRFDFNFNIRSVLAIAPVDGQYKPAGEPSRLKNLNYFVLHGSWDGDMRSFHGARVLERTGFEGDGDWFKASLYVHRANHGQFNTVWGRSDAGGPYTPFLNLRPILPGADQERVASVFISAFLEATLHDRREYRALLRDWRTGAAWLPKTIYLQKYEEARSKMLATYEEDLDLTTTTAAGGRTAAENLSDWKEKAVGIKWGGLDTRAVFLGWNRKEAPGRCSYVIELPQTGFETSPDSVLTFSLADTKDKPSSYRDEEGEGERKKAREDGEDDSGKRREPIDLTLEVTDRMGNAARLPLSHYSKLQPQIEAEIQKASFMSSVPSSEVVYQTFEFPLGDFAAVTPKLDPAALRSIRLVFDRTEKGVVILDGVGFRQTAR